MSRYAAADSFMAIFGLKRMSVADMLAERSKLLAQIAQIDEAIVSQGVRPIERPDPIATTRELVLAVLRDGPATADTIRKATGQDEHACHQMLSKMKREGLVRRLTRGTYTLPEVL